MSESESLIQQIQDKAKLGTEIENLLDTDIEEEWKKIAETKWVKLETVLALLQNLRQQIKDAIDELEEDEWRKLTIEQKCEYRTLKWVLALIWDSSEEAEQKLNT